MPRLIVEEPAQLAQQPSASPASFGALQGQAMQRTGRVTQALGEVLQEYGKTKAKAAAVQYGNELEAEANKLSLDPDIEKRGQKFDAIQRKIASKYRGNAGIGGLFDQYADTSTQEVRSRFEHKTMLDGIAESRRNVTMEVESLMLRAATTEDDEEVGVLFQEAQVALGDSDLFMTKAEQEQTLRDSVGVGLRAMAQTNPHRMLKWTDRLGSMLGPEVTAVYREQALTNIRQAAAAQVAEERQARQDRINAEKDASLSAEDRLMDLERSGRLTLAAVQSEGDLSPAAYKRWKTMATGGGGSGATDPDLYVALSESADAGEDIREKVNAAVNNGITVAQRDSLLKRSKDMRFGDNRKYISDALDPGALASDIKMRVKRVRALQSFDDWTRKNPEATFEEAQERADFIIRAATTKLPSLTYKGNAVKSKEDLATQVNNVVIQMEGGIISESEAKSRLKELKRISDEMEARLRIGEQGAEGP